MPHTPTAAPTDDEDAPPQRSQRMLIALGALGAVSVVIAALVIFSSGGSAQQAQDPEARVRASDDSLIVGKPDAARKVVVFEDFGSSQSRDFDIASRDFLRVEAAQGRVLVEYHPVALDGGDYSLRALGAWGGVLHDGRAGQALALHDLLFDKQPGPGESAPHQFIALAKEAGVRDTKVLDGVATPERAFEATARRAAAAARVSTTPTVLLDGKPLTAADPTALADRLQRQLLGE